VILYRVEHELTKLGPYVHTLEHHVKDTTRMEATVMAHNGDVNNHPCPWNDGMKKYAEGMRYAFFTTKALRNWFDGYLDLLRDEGFKLVEVEV
jgi:hypothetical protein